MAEAVVVNGFRKRLAAYMAGKEDTLKPIGYMVFGDGGHNADLTPKTPSADATALANEVLRKPIASIVQEDELSVTGACTVEQNEIIGTALSEAGLLDTAGNLIGYKNFAPKVKESDERYDISVKLRF